MATTQKAVPDCSCVWNHDKMQENLWKTSKNHLVLTTTRLNSSTRMGTITWGKCQRMVRNSHETAVWSIIHSSQNWYSYQYHTSMVGCFSRWRCWGSHRDWGKTKWSILEIKCPCSGRTMTPDVACQDINQFCNTITDGNVILKKTHNYYYQVQGQLRVTLMQLSYLDTSRNSFTVNWMWQ